MFRLGQESKQRAAKIKRLKGSLAPWQLGILSLESLMTGQCFYDLRMIFCNVEWCATIFISCIYYRILIELFYQDSFSRKKCTTEVKWQKESLNRSKEIQITTHINSIGFEDQTKPLQIGENREDMYRLCDGWIIFDGILHDDVPTGFCQLNWLVCRNTSVKVSSKFVEKCRKALFIPHFSPLLHIGFKAASLVPKNLWKIWRSPTFAWMKRSGTQLMLWRDLVKKINSQLRLKHVFFQCAFFLSATWREWGFYKCSSVPFC